MTQRSRRTFLIGAGALAAGAAGLRARQASDAAPIGEPPRGWFLVSRWGQGGAQALVARDQRRERELDSGSDVSFLSAAISPDRRFLAVLKRVPRGSMPTDAVAVFDTRTFAKLSETEAQIAFQRTPSYALSWSADSTRIAVPYNGAERTLIFGVDPSGRVGLKLMRRQGHFMFHPTAPDRAVYQSGRWAKAALQVVRLADGARDQQLEQLAGSAARWSPDGAKLAYLADREATLVIREESTRANLARLPLEAQATAWSPDSRRLAAFYTATNDPLRLGELLPPGMLPPQLSGETQQVLVYDTAERRQHSIGGQPAGFQLARLLWLADDWLLVLGARPETSQIIDRRGEQRLPVALLDAYTPFVAWLPEGIG